MFKRWLYPELRGFRLAHNRNAALRRAIQSSRATKAWMRLLFLVCALTLFAQFVWPGFNSLWYDRLGNTLLLCAFGSLSLPFFPACRREVRAHLRLELLQLRRCPDCFYDLRATELPRCPECGLALSGVTPGDAETR
ncbi:hypothetical protein RAS2_23020 [Phycisphaerae bacterium RAS2]|nr:hypothetical protein RAS2_23020 [Phycisphaerae bacterium RAS2]